MFTELGAGFPAQKEFVQISPPPASFCPAARISFSGGFCCCWLQRHHCIWWEAEAKLSEGSPTNTSGSHQILLGIKPGEGKSLLAMKKSSLLHRQGGERRVLSGPKKSLNFPAPALRAVTVIMVVCRVCWQNKDQARKWSPTCFCCRWINICKLQILICRSASSVGEVVPLGKGLEWKPVGPYGWICTNGGYGCYSWPGRKGLSRVSCKAE